MQGAQFAERLMTGMVSESLSWALTREYNPRSFLETALFTPDANLEIR